ncbi:LruC domain-containing protein [Pseudoalteromonas luteoviolacea]|uniref:LruC domain-containing protein n=1 Tax=Pseudoalteromonas luteoviolacea S4054 TaxID=1129367 RepID=A0A0F6AAC5_9GAMM|nr:LruC domain-containing protein [Pseudoalteromonas luteoviolacea]AOT09445.1 hypothetical protein S4054249_17015 [Pseudoalteromonas luteoviolacea]AOT14357.1 hypothetical protein S40542_16985 [Pseudoalteromonas luteoviolacea]AOT19273.1 hypothetical protein S4054_16990 [Pseudoalteromonas luteoviolacea]KKE83157.1 hypothetical protein N479_15940 [Pseudoalteromonas luteoviolacea S4054]KZN73548.1 hypothetical protein N481_12605 [Pseudoalteromonas luteoviolacea S4047-1]
MSYFTKMCVSAALCTMASSAVAVQQVDGNYVWQFQSGQAWPGGYNQNTGKPDNMIYARDEYSRDFFQRISNALPEAKVNEAFITGDSGSTIHLVEEAEVFITFIHEGAGYKNSFGYFTFDPENPPTSADQIQETIVFPNLSYPHLTNGHRVSIGTHPAGTSIGFFVAANGFWYYTGVKNWQIPYYYSISSLNPEPTEDLRQHCVLLYDEQEQEVVIGFEDLPRTWGDNDFNDAVFSVQSSPGTAIQSSNLVVMPEANDSDADGIPDEQDEFPNNFRRSHSQYFPSQTGVSTLAYEDNWPQRGDYDLNDLVVKQRIQTTFDANNEVSGFILHGWITARGAAYENGYALRILDSTPALIEKATVTIDGQEFEKSVEEYQTNAVLQLWSNTQLFTQTGESGKCTHFNTVKECSYFEPIPFTLDVTFEASQPSLSIADLDFFIFRTADRTIEVHMADYPPTDLFDQTRFGKVDDSSDPNLNRYFRTSDNLPWALTVSEEFNYPREYIDVLWAYPNYEIWVESSGAQAQDWYKTSDRDTHYYMPESE